MSTMEKTIKTRQLRGPRCKANGNTEMQLWNETKESSSEEPRRAEAADLHSPSSYKPLGFTRSQPIYLSPPRIQPYVYRMGCNYLQMADLNVLYKDYIEKRASLGSHTATKPWGSVSAE